MSQDEFTKLFKYMQDEFAKIHEDFGRQDAKINDLMGAVGELGAQIKDYHEEMLFMGHKVDHLERWIHEIAKQTGVKLSAP
jgi:uncharacterized protein YoxC